MCRKMSGPPSAGVMKPWPLERQKHLQTPLQTGPCEARTVAEKVLVRRVGSGLGTTLPRRGDGERSRARWVSSSPAEAWWVGGCGGGGGSDDMADRPEGP